MKVKELIEKLKKCDKNARVVTEFHDYYPEVECRQVTTVDGYNNGKSLNGLIDAADKWPDVWDDSAKKEILVILS